ncbi:cytochrome P450 94C1-like [Syzygium oleosum]|uniref:cytochrome P450 94C1-like n=1 Tax=Syzygium oleosum TaxID=219896 RepID=UPI0011D1AEE0|nr:cytochrome P450 94C1-like [Syzygium oleosum]
MESIGFLLFRRLQASSCFFFFLLFLLLFAISISLIFCVFLWFSRRKLLCQCHICNSYRTSSWANEFNNLCDWFTHLLKKSPSQTIHIHVLGNVITANPEVVEYMLKTRFDNYPKGKPFSMILGDLLGKGIFNVDGDWWMFQRKMASLELGSISIRSYAYETVTKEIETRLLPLLSSAAEDEKRILDLQDVFQRFSFDIICNFSFGVDPGCLESSMPISSFAESFNLATKLSAERALAITPFVWKMKRLLNVGSEKKLNDAIKVVKVLAKDVISQKRKLGFSNHQDLLSRFMACVNDDKDLIDIVISFILAGQDTMASALSTFFWLLGTHPKTVSRIRSEAKEVINGDQEFVSFEQIRGLHYLHSVVYESLRLFPPIQFDSKFALKDDVLPDGTFVKQGTRVTYHPYAMARMDQIWGSDCMKFEPERWIEDGKFCPPNPYKYPVFQAGSRVCLGKEMAIVEMKIVALSVLRKFDILVVSPEDGPQFSPGLTAIMKGGVRVQVKKKRDTPPREEN